MRNGAKPTKCVTPITTIISCEDTFFFISAIALRSILLALDHVPRFFLGDSESYLYTALGVWIPEDRSWVYGLTLNWFLKVTNSLTSIIVLQTVLSAGLSASAAVLCRRIGIGRLLSWLVLIVLSIDPLALYYDRSILTDQPAAVTFWIGFYFYVLVLKNESSIGAFIAAALFLVSLSLRTVYFPLIILISIEIICIIVSKIIISKTAHEKKIEMPRVQGPLVFVITMIIGTMAYAQITGLLTHAAASINPRKGFFLLAVTAPILEEEDFKGLAVNDVKKILEDSKTKDRSLRNAQVFHELGIANQIEKQTGDWRKVSAIGATAAWRSILRDPVGFVKTILLNAFDYMSFDKSNNTLESYLGLDRKLPEPMVLSLRGKVRDDITPEMVNRPSYVLLWLMGIERSFPLRVWLSVILTTSFFVACHKTNNAEFREIGIKLCLFILIYVGSLFLLTVESVPRYLLPLSPFLAVLFAIQTEMLIGRIYDRSKA